MKITKSLFTLVATLAFAGASHAESQKLLVNKTKDGLALQGCDPVAWREFFVGEVAAKN